MIDEKVLSYISGNNLNYDELLVDLFEQLGTKKDDNSYKNIIKIYTRLTDDNRYNKLMHNFKTKYIYDEDSIEDDHDIKEHWGMRKMYDYIADNIIPESLSIFTLNILHHRLFSEVPHPEVSDGFRKSFAYLPGAPFSLEQHCKIVEIMNKELMPKTNDIIKLGVKLGKENDPDKIIGYIDSVVDLGNELIKIHPFFDGNGRTIRCFMNMLFKLAHIPPVYVGKADKEEYIKAGDAANIQKDNSLIHSFYYRKICESMYELDLQKNICDEKARVI